MPRAKNPEYFKKFEIEAVGLGNNREQAERSFKEDLKYKKKWIRGTLVKQEKDEFDRWGAGYKISSKLYFEMNPSTPEPEVPQSPEERLGNLNK